MQADSPVRPGRRRALWWSFGALLALVVAAELFVAPPDHEGLAHTFGFGAWFGVVVCAALIAIARGLGALLGRSATYYAPPPDD